MGSTVPPFASDSESSTATLQDTGATMEPANDPAATYEDDTIEDDEEAVAVGSSSSNGQPEECNNIRIFLRIKPTKKPSNFFTWNEDTSLLQYDIPRDLAGGLINNSRTNYKFRFDALIGMEATQEEVFDRVGRPCVLNALNGFNSTVFAYGQTGSGKTFTITGGAERYEDRGLIPRALSMVFEETRKNPSRQMTIHISYLEIYNNLGYDLLDENHENTKSLEDLPKVAMLEDEDGNCHLRNLSMHLVHSEEDALNLLFLGDTNRAVSETPMNLASSRSHCIFTLTIESRSSAQSEKVLHSKLHLVDLAGSERAHKTGAKGQLLKEATYINTSLHYLELVIVALHERTTKGRTHIPYRNSMMTSVLRDSLGGNCKTVMVATVSPDKEQTDESISTCRFAQRVARVRNDARLNEEIDPAIVIRQLKAQVASLQEEIAILKGDVKEGDELKEYEKDKLRQRCIDFVNDEEPTAHLNMGEFTYEKMRTCFQLLKAMVRNSGSHVNLPAAASTGTTIGDANGGRSTNNNNNQHEMLDQRILELEQTIQQRDNEIAIMVNMIKQDKLALQRLPESLLARQNHAAGASTPKSAAKESKPPASTAQFTTTFRIHDTAVLNDPAKAFEAFKSAYPKKDLIHDNKLLLKQKYEIAKDLANKVNECRVQIKQLTLEMDKKRKQHAIANELKSQLETSGNGEAKVKTPETQEEDDDEEEALKKQIEYHKSAYKKHFHELNDLKTEITHIQKLLEMNRIKLQKEFDTWYQAQGFTLLPLGSSTGESTSSSAGTPPCTSTPRKSARSDEKQIKQGDNQQEKTSHHASGSSSRSSTPTSSSPAIHSLRPVAEPKLTKEALRQHTLSPKASQLSAHQSPKPSTPTQSARSVMDRSPALANKTSSVDDDVTGFYEALDILKRRNSSHK